MFDLHYSAVDGADITLLLFALNAVAPLRPLNLSINEDLFARNLLKLSDSADSSNGSFHPGHDQTNTVSDSNIIISTRRGLYLHLASISGLMPEDETESIKCNEMLEFADGIVWDEICNSRSFEHNVLAPLNAVLEQNMFVAHGQLPSIADWALFSLIFNRVRAFTPKTAARNPHIVRWAAHLQHQLLASTTSKTEQSAAVASSSADTACFIPARFDFTAMKAALNEASTVASKDANVKKTEEEKIKDKKNSKKSNQQTVQAVAEHPLARVDLRVGRIVDVQKHPVADRLFVETVDLGEESPRTVVSGLVGLVELEELRNRLCIFVCNLKPATLCKTLSSAMLLVSSLPETEESSDSAVRQLEPIVPPSDAKPGDRISIDGVQPQPDAVIRSKDDTWTVVKDKLSVRDGVVYYQDAALCVHGRPDTIGKFGSAKVPNGIVS